MKFTLRGYQQELVDRTAAAMAAGGVPALVCPTGGGKSVMIAEMARLAIAAGHRVVAVAHRQEIVQQLMASLRAHLPARTKMELIVAGRRARYDAQVTVGMVPTMARRLGGLDALRGAVMLCDECFPSGTMVSGRPIETIRPGDLVEAFDHASGQVVWRPVVRLFRNPMPETMVRMRFSNGASFLCTPSHPVWADGAYVSASAVKAGAKVVLSTMREHLVPDPLRDLRTRGPADEKPEGKSEETRINLLLSQVQRHLHIVGVVINNGGNESSPCIQTNDGAQPYEAGGCSSQGLHQSQNDGMEAACAGRQRQAADTCSAVTGGGAGMGYGSDCQDRPGEPVRRLRVPTLLQAGHRESVAEDRDRSGRQQSLLAGAPISGSEERGKAGVAWVESVEVLQSAGDGVAGELLDDCENCYVYNVEVAEHHNYFAESVLVHNCHHCGASSWASVISAISPAMRCGFTATPIRPNGRGLGDEGGFTELVIGPQVAELIEAGSLAYYRLFASPNRITTEGLRLRAGEFRQADLEARVIAINGSIVADWQRWGQGQKTITVCVGVDHAREVAERFQAAGIAAATVNGKTPSSERDRIFESFRSGRLLVLTACAVVDEGLDVPEATVLQLTRPTASLRLWKQLVGRVLRPAPGKDGAIILDHTDTWQRLPAPDADIEWSLHAEAKQIGPPRLMSADPITAEITLQPLSVAEFAEAELQEITPSMFRNAKPKEAREMLARKAAAEIALVAAGQAPPMSLMPWLSRVAVLDEPTACALGEALGYGSDWGRHAWRKAREAVGGDRINRLTRRLQHEKQFETRGRHMQLESPQFSRR